MDDTEFMADLIRVRDYIEKQRFRDNGNALSTMNEAIRRLTPVKPDWRVGLTVKAKYAFDAFAGELGAIVAVHPSGTRGIIDPAGVLEIQLDSGSVAFVAADRWMTA